MDKEKEIEKIKDIILSGYLPVVYPQKFDDLLIQQLRNSARRLVEAGYGDTKAAVKEFAYKVKELIHGFENISQSTDNCLCEKIDELIEKEYGDEV